MVKFYSIVTFKELKNNSLNFNCAQNLIKAGVGEQACGSEEE
jgi:hypothetical protein